MKLKKIVFLLALLTLLLSSAKRSDAATPWLHTEGNKIKDPNGNNVILRGINLIDLGSQERFYDGVITAINRITNRNDPAGSSPGWYPKVIRLPILPAELTSSPTWQPGSDTFYNTILRPAIDHCKVKDVYCIIDLQYVANTYEKDAFVRAFWTYMAPRFANDSHVIFDLFNEPINTSAGNNAQKWASVRANMQPWVDLVRARAPRNLILVGTPQWCQILSPVINNPINGTNIVYPAHTYPGHWASQSLRDEISRTAAVLPVIMGEWGFRSTDPQDFLRGTISSFGQPVANFREQLGIGGIAWVASPDWRPTMFGPGWVLRVGEGEMGGFTKDWLYTFRNSNLPSDGNPTPTPTPSPGVTPQPGVWYSIVARHSGQALDVAGASTANGGNVLQWPVARTPNQQWMLTSVGSGVFRFNARHSNLALDVDGVSTADGANVQQWAVTNGANQQWSLTATTGGYFRIVARHSNKCLEVAGGSTANGANVQQNTCNNGTNQQWRFQAP